MHKNNIVAGIRHLFSTITGLSPVVYLLAIAAFITPLVSTDFYLMELMVIVLLYSLFAGSWDVLSGYTDQPNFGHALFIGGAGYISALLSRNLDIVPFLSIPVAAGGAALMGLIIGTLTLRLRGPYFALATIAFSAMAYKLTYIWWPITGGEEGLTGVDPFTNSVEGDLMICAVLFLVCVILLSAFTRSRYGLILRSTRHNEDAALASGVNTAYYKIAGFTVSGFFAGVAGSMYTHTHMQVTPSMLEGSLSVLIVLLATVGGRGTLVGPILAAGLLAFFNQWLRIVEEYRIILFMGTLILLVYMNPNGIANALWLKKSPVLRRILLGRS